jgi:hypothetical protein
MKARNLAVVAILLGAHVVNAQERGPGQERVMYDPLFWKHELSLKNSQSRKIEEINREFYDGLRRLKEASYTKSELQAQLDLGLQERSVKIWATLHGKQKRRLEKILEANALQGP